MGTQERFFGRWLLPALPALAILAGLGATRLLDLVAQPAAAGAGGGRRRGRGGARGAGSLLQRARRPRAVATTTRATSRAPGWRPTSPPGPRWWSSRSCPTPGSPTPTPRTRGGPPARADAVRAALDQVPDRAHDGGRAGAPAARRQGTLRERRGLRAHPAPGPDRRVHERRVLLGGHGLDPVRARDRAPRTRCRARSATTAALARRADVVYRVTPYADGEGPVEFDFDWSFNQYPRAYERPGPSVVVYRLRDGRCAPLQAPTAPRPERAGAKRRPGARERVDFAAQRIPGQPAGIRLLRRLFPPMARKSQHDRNSCPPRARDAELQQACRALETAGPTVESCASGCCA